MAASSFVVSNDELVASNHLLSQSLLARFFWSEPKSVRLVQSTLARKWRLRGSLPISPEEFGLRQLFFSDKSDVNRVLGKRPLSYDDIPIGIQRWVTPTPELASRLRFMDYWVLLLDLPKHIRSLAVGEGVASIIGKVLDAGIFDSANEADYFVRCLV
ncbi:hypothetical protein LINGRAHAP2_LOCUS2324 [Linum grandiflorum]